MRNSHRVQSTLWIAWPALGIGVCFDQGDANKWDIHLGTNVLAGSTLQVALHVCHDFVAIVAFVAMYLLHCFSLGSCPTSIHHLP